MAALQEARRLKPGQNCVLILADGVRNYMTKFVDDQWMRENRFSGDDVIEGTVAEMTHSKNGRSSDHLDQQESLTKAIDLMRHEGISQIPITAEGQLAGLLTEKDLLEFLTSGERDPNVHLIDVMRRSVPTVLETTPLSALDEMLDLTGSVVVVDDQRHPQHILTKIDLVEWLVHH